jgi:hypothetical protein
MHGFFTYHGPPREERRKNVNLEHVAVLPLATIAII